MPEPMIENISVANTGDLFLTNAIWHNSMGSHQPETGLRRKLDTESDQWADEFYLFQHNCDDWQAMCRIIVHAWRRQWPYWKICELFERATDSGRMRRLREIASNLEPVKLSQY